METAKAALLCTPPTSVIVNGLDGIGKTTFARQVVADAGIDARYEIVWVDCTGIVDVPSLRRAIGTAMSYRDQRRALPSAPQPFPTSTTSGSMPRSPHLLLVLDTIDQLCDQQRLQGVVSALLQHLEEKAALLITMQSAHDIGIRSTRISLSRLNNRDSENLFVSFDFTARFRKSEGLADLVARFDGFPLAITLAARLAPYTGGLDDLARVLKEAVTVGGDALDGVVRAALDHPTLDRPDARRLVRIVAYWPKDLNEEDYAHMLHLGNPAYVRGPAEPGLRLGVLGHLFGRLTMSAPVKARVLAMACPDRFDIMLARRFCFEGYSQQSATSHRPTAIITDAFQDSDPSVVEEALDAIIRWRFDGAWPDFLELGGDCVHAPQAICERCRYWSPFIPFGSDIIQAAVTASKKCSQRLQAFVLLLAIEEVLSCANEHFKYSHTSLIQQVEGILASIPRIPLIRTEERIDATIRCHLLLAYLIGTQERYDDEVGHFRGNKRFCASASEHLRATRTLRRRHGDLRSHVRWSYVELVGEFMWEFFWETQVVIRLHLFDALVVVCTDAATKFARHLPLYIKGNESIDRLFLKDWIDVSLSTLETCLAAGEFRHALRVADVIGPLHQGICKEFDQNLTYARYLAGVGIAIRCGDLAEKEQAIHTKQWFTAVQQCFVIEGDVVDFAYVPLGYLRNTYVGSTATRGDRPDTTAELQLFAELAAVRTHRERDPERRLARAWTATFYGTRYLLGAILHWNPANWDQTVCRPRPTRISLQHTARYLCPKVQTAARGAPVWEAWYWQAGAFNFVWRVSGFVALLRDRHYGLASLTLNPLSDEITSGAPKLQNRANVLFAPQAWQIYSPWVWLFSIVSADCRQWHQESASRRIAFELPPAYGALYCL